MNNSFVFFIALVRPKQDDEASSSPLLQHLCEMQSAQLIAESLKCYDEYCCNTLYIHTLLLILRFTMESFSLYHSFHSSAVLCLSKTAIFCCCLQTIKPRTVLSLQCVRYILSNMAPQLCIGSLWPRIWNRVTVLTGVYYCEHSESLGFIKFI
jgi:hypothetical protein